jgi:hypothetical protein
MGTTPIGGRSGIARLSLHGDDRRLRNDCGGSALLNGKAGHAISAERTLNSASGDVAKAKTPGLLESSVPVSFSLRVRSYTCPFSYRPWGLPQNLTVGGLKSIVTIVPPVERRVPISPAYGKFAPSICLPVPDKHRQSPERTSR